MDNLQCIFSKIYENEIWSKKSDVKAKSGSGSLIETTTEYRTFLYSKIKEYKINNVLDIGCGYWEHLKEIDWKNINYDGIDIVEDVITYNKKFQTDNIKFYLSNIFQINDLYKYDLVIIKDVFQHLSIKNILSILQVIYPIKYWCITNDVDINNQDCEDGSWRGINLKIFPFHLIIEDSIQFKSIPHIKESCFIKSISNHHLQSI